MTHQSPNRRAVRGSAVASAAAHSISTTEAAQVFSTWTEHADAYRAAVVSREAAVPTDQDDEKQQDVWEAKVDAASKALKAACGHPAPTLSALVEKCDMLSAEYPDADCLDGFDCSYIMADVRRLAAPVIVPDQTQGTNAELFAELDRHDAWAVSASGDDLNAWCDSAYQLLDRVEALPNTPENLAIRARAIGSGTDNTSDPSKLNLSELGAHAEGHVGRLVRQMLCCVMGGGSMTAIATPPSLMQALHTRFEATHQEASAIEAAQAQEDEKDFAERGKLHRALTASEVETDMLRYAILTQIPGNWKDGLLLAYHVRLEQDFQANIATPFERRDPRPGILANAIDALLNFMCCETDLDHAEIGPQFQEAANRVFSSARYRTGMLDA